MAIIKETRIFQDRKEIITRESLDTDTEFSFGAGNFGDIVTYAARGEARVLDPDNLEVSHKDPFNQPKKGVYTAERINQLGLRYEPDKRTAPKTVFKWEPEQE